LNIKMAIERSPTRSGARKFTLTPIFRVERSRALLAEKVEEAVEATRALPGGGRLGELRS
jgi:hypothetical protein